MCVSEFVSISCVFSCALFFLLFVLSYPDLILFCLLFYSSLDACLFSKESQEGCGFGWERRWENLGGVGEREIINRLSRENNCLH